MTDTADFSKLFVPPGAIGVGDPNDRLMGTLITPGSPESAADVGIVGIPFDTSVLGRRGTRYGPDAIRRALGRAGSYALSFEVDLAEELSIADFGDVRVLPTDVQETHRQVERAIAALRSRGIVPCLLGGDHGTTYATIRGVALSLAQPIGVIQIDAHLDVRQTVDGVISSGTPFRRLLESPERPLWPANLVQMGIADWRNAHAYVRDCRAWGTRMIPAREIHSLGCEPAARQALTSATRGTTGFFLTFDMDACDVPSAPGTSAHSPGGLASWEAIELIWTIAQHPACLGFDVVETAPPLDVQEWTSELAATLVLTFLAGVARRKRDERSVAR
ncbi:MAG: agmatinase family protein [Chloroflexi bacterium]|nr:agmatinase family protein [Chloroflexota bacterium]